MATKRAKGKAVKPEGSPKRGAPDSERIFAPDEDEPVPTVGRPTTMKTRRKPDDEKVVEKVRIDMTRLWPELVKLVDMMEETTAAAAHFTGLKFDLESSRGTPYVVAIEPRKSNG
jgi:hypothetical protein